MNFTFGIITDFGNPEILYKVIDSIVVQNIPNYEILIVGPYNQCPFPIYTVYRFDGLSDIMYPGIEHISLISFDDNQRPGWITKKKNLVTQYAKYENVVYLHDYISFDDNWYEGMLKLGNDWDVCMNKIENLDGTRFRDWLSCGDPIYCPDVPENYFRTRLVPYSYDRTQYMYVSGSYWVAKKEFMKKYPQDENLVWGQGEDWEWSKRVRKIWNYKLADATVKLLKQKEDPTPIITAEELARIPQ